MGLLTVSRLYSEQNSENRKSVVHLTIAADQKQLKDISLLTTAITANDQNNSPKCS